MTHPDPGIPTALVGDPSALEPALAELLASAVTSTRDVVALSEGPFGEVATHLAGRRVPGVRIHEDRVEVHVIARWGALLPVLAEQVRAACAPLVEGRMVDVSIDDVLTDEPDEVLASAGLGSGPPSGAQDIP